MSARLLDALILILPFLGMALGWIARGADAEDKMARAFRRGVEHGRRSGGAA